MKKKLLAIPLIILSILLLDVILFIVDYYHATDDVKNYIVVATEDVGNLEGILALPRYSENQLAGLYIPEFDFA